MDCILQWNLQSYRTKFSELKQLINFYSPICICLQETLLKPGNNYPPSQYNLIHSSPTRADGHERGAGILVHTRVHFETVDLNTDLQAVAVSLFLRQKYTVCSLYLPHVPVNQQDINNLLQQLPSPFLLLGDMNAKSFLWGSDLSDTRGRLFEEALLTFPMSLLTDGSPTHYHVQTNSYSTIDLSFCSTSVLDDFEYSVLNNLHDSDHFPILIKWKEKQTSFRSLPRYKSTKADWTKFKAVSNVPLDPFAGTVQQLSDSVRDLIIHAADESIPKTSGHYKRTPVPWWNEDCREARRERNRAERALKRNHTNYNKIRYSRAKAIARNTFNSARRESWQEFVSSINQTTSLHSVWKRVQKIDGKFKSAPHPQVYNSAGSLATSTHAAAETLAEHFANVSGDHNYSDNFLRYKRQQEQRPINFGTNIAFHYNDVITDVEFRHALSSCQESSPGEDEVTYSMIKNLHPTIHTIILSLFNRIFSEHVFPSQWHEAIVVAILKLGKDPHFPVNYRPISLSNCLCKLLEKIVNYRLIWFLESNSLINISQSGFRRNRSTTDHLLQMETDIRTAIDNRLHTIAVLFDIQKAYDTAWRYGVLRSLYDYGLRGSLPIFVANFLSRRSIRVRVGSAFSGSYVIPEGIPQGSVLSCTCFLIAINSLPTSIPHGIKSLLYVDDLAIYVSGSNENAIQRRLQVALNSLMRWSDKTGFQFSPTKTHSIHICRKRNCAKMAPLLTLADVPIRCEDSCKYLGLTFDNSLTWRLHITTVRTSCLRTLNLFWKLSGTKWGADSVTLRRLFIMLLKPKLEYGIEAYASAAPTYMKLIETLQHSALRIATGSFRSSPLDSLHAISCTLPPKYALQLKHLNYFLRLVVTSSHPLHDRYPDLDDITENTIGELPRNSFTRRCFVYLAEYDIAPTNILMEVIPIWPPWRIASLSVCPDILHCPKEDIPQHITRAMFLDHLCSHSDSYIIYTDGSKSEVGTGYAWVSGDLSTQCHLSSHASIYTAELLAIKSAIDHSLTLTTNSIVIVTDSQSAIQAISSIGYHHPIVNHIRDLIISSDTRFTLCWVPSHVGVPGNDQADELARKSIVDLPETPFSLPRSDLKLHIKNKIHTTWHRAWNDIPLTNKLREILPSISSKFVDKNPRHWSVPLTRILIGHTRLTHGFLMTGGPRPYCADCLVPLTVKHIISECPNYVLYRHLFGAPGPPNYSDYFRGSHTVVNGSLHSFFRNIGLLHEL